MDINDWTKVGDNYHIKFQGHLYTISLSDKDWTLQCDYGPSVELMGTHLSKEHAYNQWYDQIYMGGW